MRVCRGKRGEYRNLAEELFEDVPSAEAVQGEWILDGGTPICSVCHEEPCWSSEGYDFTDFCPNCGADMRGDKE